MEQLYQSVCRGEFTESLTTMSGLFAIIALSVFADISHNGVLLSSLLCITVSGSCWYHLSVMSISWSLQIIVPGDVLCSRPHIRILYGSAVSSYCEHILHLLSTCWPHLLSCSFWRLLPGLELRQVVPLFFLSDYLTNICWWWLCQLEASLESWDTGHAMFWFPLFFFYGFHLRLEYVF